MTKAKHTPGPWTADLHHTRFSMGRTFGFIRGGGDIVPMAMVTLGVEGMPEDEGRANARLIAAAPDHALICWAMCVQDASWEEWDANGRGEFCFCGLRYATQIDEFGAPILTPALRAALTKAGAAS